MWSVPKNQTTKDYGMLAIEQRPMIHTNDVGQTV